MFYKVQSQAPLQVVSLNQAKRQLNIIDDDEDDTHIQLLIDSATDLTQKYANRLLSIGNVDCVIQGKSALYLYGGEVQNINSVTYRDGGEDAPYTFDDISQIFSLEAEADLTKEIVINYDVGYSEVPAMATMGALMIISSLYENRENTVTGVSVADIPLDSMKILDAIRIEAF